MQPRKEETTLIIKNMRPMIKILLAEDHSIVRSGIRFLLEKEPDLSIAAEASNGSDILAMIEKGSQYDVILVDLNLPDMRGIELIKLIKRFAPDKKTIVLSAVDEENSVLEAFSAGAMGYLLKSVQKQELLFAIRHIVSGNRYICSDLTGNMLVRLSQPSVPVLKSKVEVGLSKREVEVLALIAEGYTNNEIANKLFTSRRTIEGHRKNLIDKTGARNTATLIRFAVTNGLLQ